jgi:hypothetical protein
MAASRYGRLGADDGDTTDTDVDLVYLTEMSAADTDGETSLDARFLHSINAPARMAAPARLPPRVAANKHIYVMFMTPRRQGMRASSSVRDYLVNDVLPYVVRCDFVHAELVFGGDPPSTLISAMNTDGVTFVDQKRYSPAEYPVVFDIELTASRYAEALQFAQRMLVGKRYDTTYFYFYVCIGILGMQCNNAARATTYTCVSVVAAILAMIGIGDPETQAYLRADKNITADHLFDILDRAYSRNLHISKQIERVVKLASPPPELRLVRQ